MDQPAHAGHRRGDRARIAHVALVDLQIEAFDVRARTRRPHQGADAATGPLEPPCHGGADKARRSRDQDRMARSKPRNERRLAIVFEEGARLRFGRRLKGNPQAFAHVSLVMPERIGAAIVGAAAASA